MAKLNVGDKMPNFTFNTQNRENVTIDEAVKGKKKTVFWVLRYIGCTTCRYDVHVISQRYQEFLDKDAQVFVVMQSDPQIVRDDLANSPIEIPIEIICDTDLNIYKTLNIETWGEPGSKPAMTEEMMAKFAVKIQAIKETGFVHGKYEGIEEQLPAMFITDDQGVVTYAHYAKDMMDMPNVDEVLAML